MATLNQSLVGETNWKYRDRLCNLCCSPYGSEPVEIMKLTRALNNIVKFCGETSLSDPSLWQTLRGKNFSDRMIESAVKHVQDGIRMKCISQANELKEKELREREMAQCDLADALSDALKVVDPFGSSDRQEDIDFLRKEDEQTSVLKRMLTKDVISELRTDKMKSLGHDKFRRKDCSFAEIARVIDSLKKELTRIAKDLGVGALDDPEMERAFRDFGANSDDYQEAVHQVKRECENQHVFDSLMKRFPYEGMRLVASTANPWDYARKHTMREGDVLFDTETQKSMLWRDGFLVELSSEPRPEVKRKVEQIEAVIGSGQTLTAAEISKQISELVAGEQETHPMQGKTGTEAPLDMTERLAGMGVTFSSPDESVRLLAEKLEKENPQKDEDRWKKKRIIKEEGHFENLRNSKYGADGKKGSLWSKIKSALCGN